MNLLWQFRVKSVDKVIDGDTIDVTLDLGFNILLKERVRLAFVNTPEVRGVERPEGLIAKQFVIDWLKGKQLMLLSDSFKPGKYGRTIGDLLVTRNEEGRTIVTRETLSGALLESGNAKPYE